MDRPSPIQASAPEAIALPWRAGDAVILFVVLLVALGVRYSNIGHPPDYDELWHLGLTTGHGSPIGQIKADLLYLDPPRQTSLADARPVWEIWTHMDGVLHPPLYVSTLRLWRDVFGESDAAAETYSVAWSMVAIAFCFMTARLASDRVSAAFVTLAMAAARTQVYFAQAIRGYEMLIGLGAIALWLMVLIETRGATRRRLLALAASTVPLLLTHYFAFGAVAMTVTYGLWRGRGHRTIFLSAFGACAGFYAATWLPFAIRQAKDIQSGDMFLHVASIQSKNETLWLVGMPLRLIVDASQTTWFSAAVSSVLMLGVIASLCRRWNAAVIPLALWLWSTIAMLAALDVLRHTQHALYIRYAAVASAAVFPLCASLGAVAGRGLNQISATVLLLIAIFVRPPGAEVMGEGPGFATIAHWLARGNLAPGEGILIFHGDGPLDYGDNVFIHLSHEPGIFPRPVVKVEQPLSDELCARLPRRVWLVGTFVNSRLLNRTFPGVKVLETVGFEFEGQLFHLDLRPDLPESPR